MQHEVARTHPDQVRRVQVQAPPATAAHMRLAQEICHMKSCSTQVRQSWLWLWAAASGGHAIAMQSGAPWFVVVQ